MMKAHKVTSRRRKKRYKGAEVLFRSQVTMIGEKGLGLIQHTDKLSQNGYQIETEIFHQGTNVTIEESEEIGLIAHQIGAEE